MSTGGEETRIQSMAGDKGKKRPVQEATANTRKRMRMPREEIDLFRMLQALEFNGIPHIKSHEDPEEGKRMSDLAIEVMNDCKKVAGALLEEYDESGYIEMPDGLGFLPIC